jgi:pyruvate formate lyase activating enzyme
MAGCNFKCLNCQNWEISQYPDNGQKVKGFITPKALAKECIKKLSSPQAKSIQADRIFFSGGEATISLPYIEEVVMQARAMAYNTKVNFDTNGFLTEKSLERVLRFANSITYDLKAYHDSVHRAITGCSVEPVLRNATLLIKEAKEKLWEFRILVIPGINEAEIEPLAEFIASLDPASPTAFLAFRPNFILENHPGASRELLDHCLIIARKVGLKEVKTQGYTGLWGIMQEGSQMLEDFYDNPEAKRAASYALAVGCNTHPRDCTSCLTNQSCPLKRFQAHRFT